MESHQVKVKCDFVLASKTTLKALFVIFKMYTIFESAPATWSTQDILTTVRSTTATNARLCIMLSQKEYWLKQNIGKITIY